MPKRLPIALAALLLAALALGLPGRAAANTEPRQAAPTSAGLCAQPIAEAERRHGIPRGLLAAIGRAESGRYDPDRSATAAWPWTINAEGTGRFFPSKAEAVAHTRRLRQQGVSSVDVGCMQVNLHHHPSAFDDLEEAFDPAANVDYAAQFLASLFEETKSWSQAVAFYHSRTPEFHVPYRAKVFEIWGQGHRLEAEARREQAAQQRLALGTWQLDRREAQQQRVAELRRRLEVINPRSSGWQPTRMVPMVIRPGRL